MSAAHFKADYEDKDTAMIEYRTYILGESMVHWFVFRVEQDKFKDHKDQFDSIVNSFQKVRQMPNGIKDNG